MSQTGASLFNEVWRLRDWYRQVGDHGVADRLDYLLAEEMGAEAGPIDLLRPTVE